jgi:hypothetical protein
VTTQPAGTKEVSKSAEPVAANEPHENTQASPPPLRETIARTMPLLEQGKAHHAKQAAEYGLALDLVKGFYDLTERVPAEKLQPYAAGFDKFKTFLQVREKSRQFSTTVSSSATAMIGTATAVGSFVMPDMDEVFKSYLVQTPYWKVDQAMEYAQRLEKLDPELGRYYRGISEAFFGLTENAERTAFSLARQCFDHLFAILVPDDEDVRRSRFFRKKDGEKPDVVSRVERIKFAASTRIRDAAQADLLAEQAAEMVSGYGRLQELHAREAIDREHARAVLRTFMAAIEQWIDALGL